MRDVAAQLSTLPDERTNDSSASCLSVERVAVCFTGEIVREVVRYHIRG